MSNCLIEKKPRRLNYKKVFLVILIIIFIFFLHLTIVHKNRILKNNLFKDSEILNRIAINEMEAKKLAEKERKLKEEKKYKRFLPLNEDELGIIDKIYTRKDEKQIFITIDDGPTKQVTPEMLRILREHNVKANFFVLGMQVERYPDILRQEYEEGHFIGNHSYTHRYNILYKSLDSVLDEYNRTNDQIKRAINNEFFNPLIFRFPGGIPGFHRDVKLQAIEKFRQDGIGVLDWNVLLKDAENAKTKDQMLNNFYEGIKNKSSIVLLLHDAADKYQSVLALEEIIKFGKQEGYKFKTFYDILNR